MKEQWITPTMDTLNVALTEHEVGTGDSEDIYVLGLRATAAASEAAGFSGFASILQEIANFFDGLLDGGSPTTP